MSADAVNRLSWRRGDLEARWRNAIGEETVIRFERPPNSVCELEDTVGVIVVEEPSELGESNAIVFNADGSERGRVTPPRRRASLYQAYWEGPGLRLFFDTTGEYFACTPNEETLECSDVHEAR